MLAPAHCDSSAWCSGHVDVVVERLAKSLYRISNNEYHPKGQYVVAVSVLTQPRGITPGNVVCKVIHLSIIHGPHISAT